MLRNVVQKNRQCEPETGALRLAFRCERCVSAPRIIARDQAVFGGQFSCQKAKIAGGKAHYVELFDSGTIPPEQCDRPVKDLPIDRTA